MGYVTESDIRVNSYDHLNFSRASVVQFREFGYIMRLNRAFCDIEAIYTFEGTYDINTLVTGREITGIFSLYCFQDVHMRINS